MTLQQVHPFDLEPSLLDRQTYSTRRRRHLLDAGAVLCLVAGLAMLVPANLIVPGMTGIGRPAILMGTVLAFGWFVTKLHPRLVVRGPQPMRWAAGAYLVGMLLGYAAGHVRGLPALEANASDRTLVLVFVYAGIALVCADGLPNRSRLDDVIRVLLVLGVTMALIGHIQFVFDVNLVEYIDLPGLVNHMDTVGFRDRGTGFYQVASTTAHYIEFSTVMALLVPFAIHVTRFGPTRLVRQLAACCGLLMAAAIPVTLSRTGFVGLVISMLVMGLFWNWRIRYHILVIGIGLTMALMFIRPGLLGTLRSLFAYAGDDPSILGRTEDYGPSFEYVEERPWFGRGLGTFIPTLYRFIDNDWLIHLITVGIVGTAGYAGLHVTSITLAAIAYRRSTRDEDRHLCACIIAAQVMAVIVAFFFDALAFSTHTTVLAIITGAAGAMWRFTHPSRQVRSAAPRLSGDRPRGSIWQPVAAIRQPAAGR